MLTINDSLGCENLGVLYFTGAGVEKNAAQAAKLYEKSCRISAGLNGCTWLAELYKNGLGVTEDSVRAAQLFQTACDAMPRKSAYACISLADSFLRGRGVERNKIRALQLYREACVAGSAYSCNYYAWYLCHDERPCTPRDVTPAACRQRRTDTLPSSYRRDIDWCWYEVGRNRCSPIT